MEVLTKKVPITKNLDSLCVGESFDFDLSRTSSVRQLIVLLGYRTNKRFSTNIKREEELITVTRIA